MSLAGVSNSASGTTVQEYKSTKVQRYSGTAVQRYNGTTVQLGEGQQCACGAEGAEGRASDHLTGGARCAQMAVRSRRGLSEEDSRRRVSNQKRKG